MRHQISRREADFNSLLSEVAEGAAFLSTEGRRLVTISNDGQVFEVDHAILREALENASSE